MKNFKWSILLYIIGGTALLLSLLYFLRPQVETKPVKIPLKKVEVLEIKKEPTKMTIRSQGTVIPGTQSSLVSQVAGRIVSKSGDFEAGGFFRKGDVLLSVESSDYRLGVTQAKSQVAQAELALQLEEQQASIAKEEWNSINSTPISPLVAREPQLAQARAALEAAKANLQRANLDLSRASIRAPFTGRVRTTSTDVGQYVTPGTPLGMIYSVDLAEVRLPVPDEALAFLQIPQNGFKTSKFKGPEVILRAPFAGKLREWNGRIVRMEGEIDAKSRMIYLVAEVVDPYNMSNNSDQHALMAGLFVEADIVGRSIEDLVSIPRAALRNSNQVLIVNSENKLSIREVNVVRESGDTAFIGNGVKNGERLCITPLTVATNGMQVEVDGSEDLAGKEGTNE